MGLKLELEAFRFRDYLKILVLLFFCLFLEVLGMFLVANAWSNYFSSYLQERLIFLMKTTAVLLSLRFLNYNQWCIKPTVISWGLLRAL